MREKARRRNAQHRLIIIVVIAIISTYVGLYAFLSPLPYLSFALPQCISDTHDRHKQVGAACSFFFFFFVSPCLFVLY